MGLNALRDAFGGSHPSLCTERGIYTAGNGRINLCGLTLATVPDLLDALRHFLPEDLGA